MHHLDGLTLLGCWIAMAATTAAGQLPEQRPPANQPPVKLSRWLTKQEWRRDTEGPVLTLGKARTFDDTHIFAPSVAVVDARFLMWYCGSSGTAHDLAKVRVPDHRYFRLGLATSKDGKGFVRHGDGAVMTLEPSRRSILTPSILRDANGGVLREDGRMRMWFTSAAFRGDDRVHAIQEATSKDGIEWSKASPIQIERAYAPSVVKVGKGYSMWFTRPSRYPWNMFHARSHEGKKWTVREEPVLTLSQPWEHYLQIYPNVIVVDGVYLMWYASYSSKDRKTTAIGFAVSEDGVKWHKHPKNPVLRPDPEHPWESHYVSSQSVIRLEDGSFRIWYASRKKPPFKNLYFALNTAVWSGPKPIENKTIRKD